MPCLTDFLVQNNFIGYVTPLLKGDWFISQEDGKLHKRLHACSVFSGDSNASFSWLLHGSSDSRECGKWITFFKLFGMVPSFCRSRCFKVVARPRTLSELLKVNEVMRQLELKGKCGIERRESVPHLYGAYWYCDGEASGNEVYRKVADSIGDVPVILKRACTEMELKHGPAHLWPEMTEGEHYWESMFNDLVVFSTDNQLQPDYLRQWIVLGWVRYAWEHGDKTVLEHSDGKPLIPSPTDYSKKQ